jgi:hypothetical protein
MDPLRTMASVPSSPWRNETPALAVSGTCKPIVKVNFDTPEKSIKITLHLFAAEASGA